MLAGFRTVIKCSFGSTCSFQLGLHAPLDTRRPPLCNALVSRLTLCLLLTVF